jgi:hypothetical protein
MRAPPLVVVVAIDAAALALDVEHPELAVQHQEVDLALHGVACEELKAVDDVVVVGQFVAQGIPEVVLGGRRAVLARRQAGHHRGHGSSLVVGGRLFGL